MAKIMVVAGGDWQIELIKKAKKMGHFVICSNLYEKSPAFPFADVCEIADVLDKNKNLQIAQKYNPDAVISDQSDIAVPTVAYLNEKLGLKGIGTEKAALFSDKSQLRIFCKNNNITIPDFKICKNYRDALSFFKNCKKAIIKPIDSQSSRGVFTVTEAEDIKKHMEETLAWSNARKEFLIEEYIEGDEFTIDGLVVNSQYYPMCISIKEMYKQNPNVSKMQTYSYYHDIYNYDTLRNTNKELIEKTGLPFGLTHSEYKFNNGKYYLIEAGARGGGSNLSGKIVPFMSGIDNYEYLIRQALDEDVSLPRFNQKQLETTFSIMRFFDFGKGKIKHIKGADSLSFVQNMLDYQFNLKTGDVLDDLKFGRMRPGHFIIGGNDLKELLQQMNDIVAGIKIDFEK